MNTALISGINWTDVLDVAVKLTPAASIIGAVAAARAQRINERRLNAETIAKNHFRQMLENFSEHSDLVFAGMTDAALAELKKDKTRYRKYSLLYATCMFAMQEVFQAVDLRREQNWARTIRSFCALFKPFLLSDGVAFQPNVDSDFLSWVTAVRLNRCSSPYMHLTTI